MVRHPDDHLAALRQAPLFAALDKHELETVTQVSHEVDVGICEELIHEREPGKLYAGG